MLNKIETLKDSAKNDLSTKDWLKGLGLCLLVLLSLVLPDIKAAITGYDFGPWNDIISLLIFVATWLIQRYVKDNTNK